MQLFFGSLGAFFKEIKEKREKKEKNLYRSLTKPFP
jgi:hypothetical protein